MIDKAAPHRIGLEGAPVRDASQLILEVGIAVGVLSLCALCVVDVRALAARSVQVDNTLARTPAIQALRVAFLVVVIGIFPRPQSMPVAWRRAVNTACAMLACSVCGDVYGALSDAGVVPDVVASLGVIDSVERRILRLASMAARAVPLLTLLAARETISVRRPMTSFDAASPRPLEVLLWLEPYLFVVGTSTLATILAAAAFVRFELAWAAPLGVDTALAGCAAAAVRAHRRRDPGALLGWLAVVVSMVMGLFMGGYAFGGPLPAPAAIGDYRTLTRTLLRDAHIALLSLGVLCIAFTISRLPRSTA